MNRKAYGRFLLAMFGLGGFLYGIDIGLISAALPCLKATTSYTDGQLSSVVAAVMLGNIPGALLAAFMAVFTVAPEWHFTDATDGCWPNKGYTPYECGIITVCDFVCSRNSSRKGADADRR